MKVLSNWNPKQAFYKEMNQGKAGYALLWLLGVPLPVLALFYFFRH